MIYDCFVFFNELDLLEIRLNELNPIVDKFVLVESPLTFQGSPKPLYFEENQSRFEAFQEKIIHIKMEKFPTFWSHFRPVKTWDYENAQRELFFQGLSNAHDNDWVLISDVDEIPNPDILKSTLDTPITKVFIQTYHKYYINGRCQDKTWPGPVLMRYAELKQISIKQARLHRDPKFLKKSGNQVAKITNGGWHLTSLGGVDDIIKKIESFSHKEFNTAALKDKERLKEIIAKGGDIFEQSWDVNFEKVDESYPKYLLENIHRFGHLIHPDYHT